MRPSLAVRTKCSSPSTRTSRSIPPIPTPRSSRQRHASTTRTSSCWAPPLTGATSRGGRAAEPQRRRGKVRELPVEITEDDKRVKLLERVREAGLDITKARYLVCAGRGIRGELGLIEELAKLIGGASGAT